MDKNTGICLIDDTESESVVSCADAIIMGMKYVIINIIAKIITIPTNTLPVNKPYRLPLLSSPEGGGESAVMVKNWYYFI